MQVWYSDNHGTSYTLSTQVFDHMDECTLAELDDGTMTSTSFWDHFSRIPSSNLPDTASVPYFPCSHIDLELLGSWNPMLCPIWGFRHGVPQHAEQSHRQLPKRHLV